MAARMKLSELRELSLKRTQGEWKVSGQCFITKKPAPHLYDSINGGTMGDAEFIAACANNIDKLLAVVEAAKAVSVFLQDRWCEDHAYRSKHLQPLVDALAALEEG